MIGARFNMLILVNCLLTLLLGCSLSKSVTSGSSPASEAELEGQKSIERYVTKCEGTYVTDIGNGEIDQWKPANIEIKPEQLTDADKLNGLEWKGLARVSGTAWRKYWPGQGWSNWFPPVPVTSCQVFRNETKYLDFLIGNPAARASVLVAKSIK